MSVSIIQRGQPISPQPAATRGTTPTQIAVHSKPILDSPVPSEDELTNWWGYYSDREPPRRRSSDSSADTPPDF